jgi:hypothetical protein
VTICPDCNGPLNFGDFPFCRGDATKHQPMPMPAVHGDDIPGGILIPHGICHDDGTPKRYDSKSEINKALRAKGWVREGETPKPRNDRWV